MPSFSLRGKRALVSGAGRGIGMAIAAGLAQAGAEVTLIARSHNEIKSVADAITQSGGMATATELDVTNTSAVTDFFATQAAFHILVNNAGTNRPKPLSEVTEADYDAVLNLNLKSAYFMSQACTNKMISEGVSGSLLHISSQMGHVGAANRSLYCASKWAMEGMNKAFALDLACHGIRSNTIAPTFIETPMSQPFLADEAFLQAVLQKIKLGRLGQVQDIMGAVVFLASDAASLVTGTSLVIDGGWTAE
ncbi:SDR family oxidoreductase [Alteromonas sp. NFXS44]|uniref:SDR family NAD(P)-dependent oxidoreductase n=1 Tax=Alteromonas sp. NFXS44 TaxID=2818435 RepID=UPI0032DE957F